jgi:hypothetical protein
MKIYLQVIAPAIILGALNVVVPRIASAQVCGEILYADTIVQQDLICEGTGLIIGANNIVVDLDGHILAGDGSILAGSGVAAGIDNSAGYSHVTIQNGTIQHFFRNILSVDAKHLHLENIVIDNSLFSGTGVQIVGGENAKILDSVFLGPGLSGAPINNGIVLSCTTSARVQNVMVDHYGSGVILFSFCPGVILQPSQANVTNSTFTRNGAGVQVIFGTNVRIVSNTFSSCPDDQADFRCWGILSVPAADIFPSLATDLDIKDNRITGKALGILLNGVTNTRIFDNQIINNDVVGIFLGATDAGVGSTNNIIKSNVVIENGFFDLWHSSLATPNIWKNNTCGTKSGADIPDC